MVNAAGLNNSAAASAKHTRAWRIREQRDWGEIMRFHVCADTWKGRRGRGEKAVKGGY